MILFAESLLRSILDNEKETQSNSAASALRRGDVIVVILINQFRFTRQTLYLFFKSGEYFCVREILTICLH